jgi:hypothetical protein
LLEELAEGAAEEGGLAGLEPVTPAELSANGRLSGNGTPAASATAGADPELDTTHGNG